MTHDKLIEEYRGRFPLGGETWVLERHRDEVEQFLIEKIEETENRVREEERIKPLKDAGVVFINWNQEE